MRGLSIPDTTDSMAEGLYRPGEMAIPAISVERLCAAMVRILPRTMLVLGIADSQAEADALARNESQADGSEHWYRYFLPSDMARVQDPEFAMGMVRHEFSRLVIAGARFPATLELDGGGTGFCIDRNGTVLTNYHLVTADVANYAREEGVLDTEVACKGLRAKVASSDGGHHWRWNDAREVRLLSNPSTARAIRTDDSGRSHLREDTATLRVVPPPATALDLSCRTAEVGEPVWMAGFPLRTARPERSRAALGYADADASLRISTGRVTSVDADDYFTTDLDGSMGSSGSPVFDAAGKVIGMFSRMTGNGPRNAFEYGHVERVHVTARLAVEGLRIPIRSMA